MWGCYSGGMDKKRKQSFAQAEAAGRNLAKGRHANHRRATERRDAEQAARWAAEKAAEELANHLHRFKNWEYSDDYKTMSRECRLCGETETRPLTL